MRNTLDILLYQILYQIEQNNHKLIPHAGRNNYISRQLVRLSFWLKDYTKIRLQKLAN